MGSSNLDPFLRIICLCIQNVLLAWLQTENKRIIIIIWGCLLDTRWLHLSYPTMQEDSNHGTPPPTGQLTAQQVVSLLWSFLTVLWLVINWKIIIRYVLHLINEGTVICTRFLYFLKHSSKFQLWKDYLLCSPQIY